MPQFAADGLSLHYESYGSGPPVVLLHGFTSTGAFWVRHGWVDALTAVGLSAVTLDLPGHGGSGAVVDPSTPSLAADVVAVLDELARERAAFFGFSFGGGIALQIALDRPERVSSLVLGGVGDPALHPAEVALDEGMRRNAELAGNDVAALLPYLQQGCWPGAPTRLEPLPFPVLVIVAEADEYMAPVDELVDRLRPTDVLRLPGRGHYQVLMDEHIRRKVVEFLAAVRS